LLTCKDFLAELSEYLDEGVDQETQQKLEEHVNECPNCWVVVDTTKKTLKVFKDAEPQELPKDVHSRLLAALQRKYAVAGD
jgi:anti-sigma factor (TIGR02949 family)